MTVSNINDIVSHYLETMNKEALVDMKTKMENTRDRVHAIIEEQNDKWEWNESDRAKMSIVQSNIKIVQDTIDYLTQ